MRRTSEGDRGVRRWVWVALLSTSLPLGCRKQDPPPRPPVRLVATGTPEAEAAPTAGAPIPEPPIAPTGIGPSAQDAPEIEFPCQSDAQCLAHRCDTQRGVCAWPCRADSDCHPGFRCLSPACIPILSNEKP